MGELHKIFPKEEEAFWKRAFAQQECMTEMRFRAGREVLACVRGREYVLSESGALLEAQRPGRERTKIFTREELCGLLLHLCKYSLYAYEEELREGYLTLEGGHRIGVAGQVVMEGERIRTIRNIAFLNLRIAHRIPGAADEVLPELYQSGRVRNTLIVSPPGCGKTTLLRELIRCISEGSVYGRARTVGVVDERSELAGGFLGVPQSDLGPRTDVLDGCPKALGMMLLIRSMSPQVLAVDEIGRPEDLEAIGRALTCGISVIATIHGNQMRDMGESEIAGRFELLVYLDCEESGRRTLRMFRRGDENEADRCGHGAVRVSRDGASVCFPKALPDQKIRGTHGAHGAHGGGDPLRPDDFAGMLSAGGGGAGQLVCTALF